MPDPSPRSAAADQRVGLAAGLGSYLCWGLLPLYFPLLAPADAVEVVAHRVLWSLVLCLGLAAVTGGWRRLLALAHRPRTLAVLACASALLAVNWLTYVYGVTSGHTVDAALGYFVNPLVTVALAVLVQRERLRGPQWVAVGLGVAAVLVITVGYGVLPWIGLALAFSFGAYGLIKKRVGAGVDALSGLAAETASMTPLALGYTIWAAAGGHATFGHGVGHTWLMVSLGVVTTVPLLGFAAAARRLPLSTIGLLQYVTPVMQFVLGVWVDHEPMPPARWAGFALVGAAIVVLVADAGAQRRTRTAAAEDATPA